MKPGKRAFDLFWTVPGVIILLVPGLVIATAVIIDDGWPPLYAQERIGLHGRPFTLLKFRSMHRGTDRRGPHLTVGDSGGVTRVGRILRRLKLDELPQLLNVLRGDMSLVGPRPEVPEYVREYTPHQREVLELVPGITGPASIKYVNESRILALHDDPRDFYLKTVMPDKIEISLQYGRECNVLSDFLIIMKTVFGRAKANGRP